MARCEQEPASSLVSDNRQLAFATPITGVWPPRVLVKTRPDARLSIAERDRCAGFRRAACDRFRGLAMRYAWPTPMQLDWRYQPPAADGDDAGFSLLSTTADEIGAVEDVLTDMWTTFVARVVPEFAPNEWDTIVVELSVVRGLFVYPASSKAVGRPPGPALVVHLQDLERRAVAQATHPECVGARFADERGALVREYASVGSPHMTTPESAPCAAKKWSDVRSTT
jgi:hypothetical protein